MSDLNIGTNQGGHTPAASTAPRPQNPYQQPTAAAYRPPVIMGQGGAQAAQAAQAASQPVVKARDSISPERLRAGDKAQQLSVVFGILAFVTLPLLFGPLAIWQGNKAESLDRYGNAGRVLGWLAIILSVLAIVGFVAVVLLVANQTGTSNFEALLLVIRVMSNRQPLPQATV